MMSKLRILSVILICILLCGCRTAPLSWNLSGNSDKANDSGIAGQSSGLQAGELIYSSDRSVQTAQKQPEANGYFYSDIKAVWVSYLELEPILKGKSKEDFCASFEKIIKNVSDTGLNTVIVHVRPFADALYSSKLFPPSAIWLENGDKSDFDPLYQMVLTAHKYRISFHAWVNPLRGETVSRAKNISDKYKIKQYYYSGSDKAGVIDGRFYLNPAYSDVRKLAADGVREIVNGYDVDAVHIDDYFYPTGEKSFDNKSYKLLSHGRSLSRFRLDNCSALVKLMYGAAHGRSGVKFGISPQGSIENNYSSQFADVKKWCGESGYADYIMPQLYYGFENSSEPFVKAAQRWKKYTENNNNIILAAGLACHKINLAVDVYAGAGKKEWAENDDVISRQIKYITGSGGYRGFALYSYKSLYLNKLSKRELNNIKKILN